MRMLGGILLATAIACGGGQPAAKPDKGKKEVRKPKPAPKKLTLQEKLTRHETCFRDWLEEDESLFDRCYRDDSTEEDVGSGGEPREGIDAIRAGARPFFDGFTLSGDTVLTLASGDELITVNRLAGIHDGPFMEVAKTGKSFGLLYAEVQDLDDRGRAGKVRVYFDNATMLSQLGLGKAKVRPVEDATGAKAPDPVIGGENKGAEQANIDAVKRGFELFNKKDWKGVVALYAPTATISNRMMPADVSGPKAIDKMYKQLAKAFPDAREEVGTMWSAGDYVAVESTFAGTNKAAAPGMGIKKATRKSVSLRALHIFKLTEGKVAEHWMFGDGLALATQLGLVAPAK